jgi:hypothetical protein
MIELQQQLPPANVIALLYQQPFYGGGNGSVRLKILDGFHFSVGGDQTPDGAAPYRGGTNFQWAGARKNRDQCQCHDNGSDGEPGAAFAARWTSIRIVIRCQTVIFLSISLFIFANCGAYNCK